MNIEEFREDLVRRRDALVDLAENYRREWLSEDGRADAQADFVRCINKRHGIQIAIDLVDAMPKDEPSEPEGVYRCHYLGLDPAGCDWSTAHYSEIDAHEDQIDRGHHVVYEPVIRNIEEFRACGRRVSTFRRHLLPHATFGDDPSGYCGCADCDPREDCTCRSCRTTSLDNPECFREDRRMAYYDVEMTGTVREVYSVEASSAEEARENWVEGDLRVAESSNLEFYSVTLAEEEL